MLGPAGGRSETSQPGETRHRGRGGRDGHTGYRPQIALGRTCAHDGPFQTTMAMTVQTAVVTISRVGLAVAHRTASAMSRIGSMASRNAPPTASDTGMSRVKWSADRSPIPSSSRTWDPENAPLRPWVTWTVHFFTTGPPG